MPPSTRVSAGLSAFTAAAASCAICANLSQPGSSARSQCDLLFGSFQNLTASIMCGSLPACRAGATARLAAAGRARRGCRGLGVAADEASTSSRASSSVNCSGGDFMK